MAENDPIQLLASLHGVCFRKLCLSMNCDYVGATVAARCARRAGRINAEVAKKIEKLDNAFNFLRHVNHIKCSALVDELDRQLNEKPNDEKPNDETATEKPNDEKPNDETVIEKLNEKPNDEKPNDEKPNDETVIETVIEKPNDENTATQPNTATANPEPRNETNIETPKVDTAHLPQAELRALMSKALEHKEFAIESRMRDLKREMVAGMPADLPPEVRVHMLKKYQARFLQVEKGLKSDIAEHCDLAEGMLLSSLASPASRTASPSPSASAVPSDSHAPPDGNSSTRLVNTSSKRSRGLSLQPGFGTGPRHTARKYKGARQL